MNKDQNIEHCCEMWRLAHQPKTDNEEYCSLIGSDKDGWARAGSINMPIRYCPWCGAEKHGIKDSHESVPRETQPEG